jgi:hypothetical protein
MFCAFYELQRQPKKAKRGQNDGSLEISFAQKNKWEKD